MASRPEAINQPTAPSTEIEPWVESRATATTQLTEDIGLLRSASKFAYEDTSSRHRASLFAEWESRSSKRGKSAPTILLSCLADLGFSWRDMARMLGVSVPAIQKWRRGEGVAGNNRRKLANLVALCDMLTDHYAVQEVASWFEMPITNTCPIAPVDLYEHDRLDLLFDYASSHVDPEQVLTDFDASWREKYRSDFEVFEAPDGELAIRAKGS